MPNDSGAWHLFERFRTRDEALAKARQKRSEDRRYQWRVHTVKGPLGKQYRVEYIHVGDE